MVFLQNWTSCGSTIRSKVLGSWLETAKETFSSNGHSSHRAAIYDTPAASGDQVVFHTNYGNFKEEDENKY